jgi:hypothetical protein
MIRNNNKFYVLTLLEMKEFCVAEVILGRLPPISLQLACACRHVY